MLQCKHPVRNAFGIAIPVIAIILTQVTTQKKPTSTVLHGDSEPEEVHSMDPVQDRLAKIAARQSIRHALAAGRLEIGEALEAIQQLMNNDTDFATGVHHFFSHHRSEDLPFLYLLGYFERLPDDARFVQLTTELRCEFESRYGPQVWMLGPYGVVPHPVE